MDRLRRMAMAVTAILHVVLVVLVALGGGSREELFVVGGMAMGGTALWPGRWSLMTWDRALPRYRAWAEEAYFVHWCALALAPFTIGVGLAAGSTWRLGYAVAMTIALWGVLVERRRLTVTELPVEVAGLPPGLVDYRIAHLSDLHIGSMCPPSRVRGWVERVRRERPALVVLTGDYLTAGTAYVGDVAAVLSRLDPPHGVWAVMGNHDYYGEGEPLITSLRGVGVGLLRNERVCLPSGLVVAGVDDRYTGRDNIDATMGEFDAATPHLVLAHDPVHYEGLARRGARVVLCGHTHWGQVALPSIGERANLAALFQRRPRPVNRARLIVSPGLGTTWIPFRLFVPPTIFVLRLVEARD